MTRTPTGCHYHIKSGVTGYLSIRFRNNSISGYYEKDAKYYTIGGNTTNAFGEEIIPEPKRTLGCDTAEPIQKYTPKLGYETTCQRVANVSITQEVSFQIRSKFYVFFHFYHTEGESKCSQVQMKPSVFFYFLPFLFLHLRKNHLVFTPENFASPSVKQIYGFYGNI